ncbi:unnamed protein product [Phytomonas sp. Hart1]|nr:unnamed protein product [Phytomonas sp. Hart1]|eukprot:CCW67607.1 unnamed protein product [Phytomonas sp. isolate Hart1]
MSVTDDAALRNSLKLGAGPGFTTNAPYTLSVSELRTAMQQHLRKNGTLKTLKTHVRGMMLTELMHQQKRFQTIAAQRRAPSDKDGVISPEAFEQLRINGKCDGILGEPSQLTDHSLPSSSSPFATWSSCLADTLIEEHLRATRRNMTLSIFSTEVEVPPLSNIGAPSDERERLEQLLFIPNSSTKNNQVNPLEDHDPPRVSVLQRLVMQRLMKVDTQHLTHRNERGIQTDDGLVVPAASETFASLECRLAAVDAKYALTFSRLGHSNDPVFFTRAEVERRLNSYKSDIHEQLRREYQQKHKLFEENKLQEVKDSLEARYRLMIQNKNEELREIERTLLVKYEQEQQRLQHSREDVERQRLELERRQKEMRTVVNDYEAQLTEQEAIQNDLRDKLRVAQLQSARWEELSGSRLMETEAVRSRELRRVDDIRRMQADHAAELRLKNEEISRLRFRMRVLVNHASDRGTKSGAKADDKAPEVVQDDLYGMLVRTEELQRNALQQQQIWIEQASREQQRNQEHWGGATAWEAPAQVTVTSPTPPPAAAIQSVCETWEAPAATVSPHTAVDVISEEKATEPAAKVPPATQPPQKTDPSHESALVVRKSPDDNTSQSSHITPASEKPAKNLSSTSSSDEASQKGKKKNTVNKPLVLWKTSTGSSSVSLISSDSSSDTSKSSERTKNESKKSDASNTLRDVATKEAISKAAALEQILKEEEASRREIQSDEDNAHKGVVWAESSQRKVVKAQLTEKLDDDNMNHGGESRGNDFSISRFVTPQQQYEDTNIIFGDSDDDEDLDLFNKDSTSSSF